MTQKTEKRFIKPFQNSSDTLVIYYILWYNIFVIYEMLLYPAATHAE